MGAVGNYEVVTDTYDVDATSFPVDPGWQLVSLGAPGKLVLSGQYRITAGAVPYGMTVWPETDGSLMNFRFYHFGGGPLTIEFFVPAAEMGC